MSKKARQTQTKSVSFCPACQSANEAGESHCWYCELDLRNSRICPHCRYAIPSDEDPCHICGRLEPVEVRPEEKLKEVEKNFRELTFWFILEFIEITLSRL